MATPTTYPCPFLSSTTEAGIVKTSLSLGSLADRRGEAMAMRWAFVQGVSIPGNLSGFFLIKNKRGGAGTYGT